MPGYAGVEYSILAYKEQGLHSRMERCPVTAREWGVAWKFRIKAFACKDTQIIGRARNNDVEMFVICASLTEELQALGYNVEEYDELDPHTLHSYKRASQRTLAEKISDILHWGLCEGGLMGPGIDYAVIAGAPDGFLLICKLGKSKHDPTLPLPDEITANGAKYPVVGLIVDGEITFVVPEKSLTGFLLHKNMTVNYRWLDLEEMERLEQVEASKREKQREKRRAKKMAAAAGAKIKHGEGQDGKDATAAAAEYANGVDDRH